MVARISHTHRMPRYQYSALIQSPTNSILSIWMSCWVPARSPRRSMENIVALLRSGCDWDLGRSYWAIHHSGTQNSLRLIATGCARSLEGMLTKLYFGEFRSSSRENLGSKLRMATRRYRAAPVYRIVRFKVSKCERFVPSLTLPEWSWYPKLHPWSTVAFGNWQAKWKRGCSTH